MTRTLLLVFPFLFCSLTIAFLQPQVGDFLLLHLLGQNINVKAYSDILSDLTNRLVNSSGPDTPSAPSTMELAPMYSNLGISEKEAMS